MAHEDQYGVTSPMVGYGELWPKTPQEEMMASQQQATKDLDARQQVANAMIRQQIARPEGALGQTKVGRSKIARPSLDQGFGAIGTALGTGANKLWQGHQKSDLAAQQAEQIAAGKGQEQMGLGTVITQQGMDEYAAQQAAAQLAEEQRLAELAKQAEQSGVGFSLE